MVVLCLWENPLSARDSIIIQHLPCSLWRSPRNIPTSYLFNYCVHTTIILDFSKKYLACLSPLLSQIVEWNAQCWIIKNKEESQIERKLFLFHISNHLVHCYVEIIGINWRLSLFRIKWCLLRANVYSTTLYQLYKGPNQKLLIEGSIERPTWQDGWEKMCCTIF